jgi:REP element-mobilizing transposase RayT
MRRRIHKQIEIDFRPHGGRRRGAGRKPVGEKAGVPHRRRAQRAGREPVLVTMKVRRSVWNLRTRRAFVQVFEALVRANDRYGLRIVHYSVQSDHIHLIVELDDPRSFSRAIQGLAVRMAKKLNALMGRRGKVFVDRFHDRVLCTPRQVRNALAYVLCNARKHGRALSQRGWRDPFSTAALFEGWAQVAPERDEETALSMRAPRSWLLRIGWRRAGGPLDVDHRPGPWSTR